MSSLHWKQFFLTSVLLLCSAASSAGQLSIAANIMPPLLQADEDTPTYYAEILDLLVQDLPFGVDVGYFPPARAGVLFDDGKYDCIFPASTQTMPQKDKLIESLPINFAKAHFFTLEPVAVNQIFDDVDLQLGVRRGFSYGEVVRKFQPQQVVEVNTELQNLGMLRKQRVDAFIAYIPDILFHLSKEDISDIYYDADTPLHVHSENIVCHATEQSTALIEQINVRIQALRKNDQLKTILGEYFVPQS